MGMGCNVFGSGTLTIGLVFAALILPVFFFRHYIQDKGVFPQAMLEHLEVDENQKPVRRAGILPYATLIAAAALLYVTHRLAAY